MARIRSLHPGQWTDEDFVELSPFARLLCLALRNEADDYGCFEWKPKRIKMRIFPADNVEIDDLLAELVEFDHIKQYSMDGKKYGAIRNFCKYQRPKKPTSFCPNNNDIAIFVGSEPHPPSGDDIPEPVPNQYGTSTENSQQKEGRKEGRKVLNPPTPLSWGDFKKIYPDRDGQPRLLDKAEEKFSKLLIEGECAETIITGLKGYVTAIKGKHLPKTATAFLDNRLYLEYLPEPDNLAALVEDGIDGTIWENVLESWPDRGQARAWLFPLTFGGVRDGTVLLSTPNRFQRDWFNNNYRAATLKAWQAIEPSIKGVEINLISQVKERTA